MRTRKTKASFVALRPPVFLKYDLAWPHPPAYHAPRGRRLQDHPKLPQLDPYLRARTAPNRPMSEHVHEATPVRYSHQPKGGCSVLQTPTSSHRAVLHPPLLPTPQTQMRSGGCRTFVAGNEPARSTYRVQRIIEHIRARIPTSTCTGDPDSPGGRRPAPRLTKQLDGSFGSVVYRPGL